MKVIRLKFVDFWPNFDSENNIFLQIISAKFLVLKSDDPEYIIYADYGNENINYNCIKIYYTAENLVPNFNLCDYAIGFHFIDFQDRYIRIPLCVMTEPIRGISYSNLRKIKNINNDLVNRKFCNFLYSNFNNADPFRLKFLEALSSYKTVDCGGSINNNIGRIVKDKLLFISEYKFTIAFENSSVEGYTTEKIVEPMLMDSLPIYWGNPKIHIDFNDESFINVSNDSYKLVDKVIERIIDLDKNDDKYIEILKKPWLKDWQYFDYKAPLSHFLENIFSQSLENAGRRAMYGANIVKSAEIMELWKCKELAIAKPKQLKRIYTIIKNNFKSEIKNK
jgi:hypothetical protein